MKRRRRPSLWRGALLGLLLLALALPGLALGLLWWTLPAREGSLTLRGLSAPVAVSFDAHGVPRIQAAQKAVHDDQLRRMHERSQSPHSSQAGGAPAPGEDENLLPPSTLGWDE